MKPVTHPCLGIRLGMRGAVLLLSHSPSLHHMACNKEKGQLSYYYKFETTNRQTGRACLTGSSGTAVWSPDNSLVSSQLDMFSCSIPRVCVPGTSVDPRAGMVQIALSQPPPRVLGGGGGGHSGLQDPLRVYH